MRRLVLPAILAMVLVSVPGLLQSDARAGQPESVVHTVAVSLGSTDELAEEPDRGTGVAPTTAPPTPSPAPVPTPDDTPTAIPTPAVVPTPSPTQTGSAPSASPTDDPTGTPEPAVTEPADRSAEASDHPLHLDDHAGHSDHADEPAVLAPQDVAAQSAEIPVQDTLLVGASWATDAVVEVRAGDRAGTWSDWIRLERADTEHAPDPGSAEAVTANPDASEPVFVGGSTRVQVRADRPVDLELSLVETVGGDGLDWHPGGTSAAAAEAAPTVRTRADWGADESLRSGEVDYAGAVRFSVLHHVGGGYWTDAEIANGCARSDDWIRSIYAYHVQSRGWWDIGYNFIVDPCGTVWEGRWGGIARPVIGAHAAGFNTGAVGVLALGTFSGSDPDPITQDMVEGIREVAAWKLAMNGADPAGTSREVSSGGSSSRTPEGTVVHVPVLSAHQVTNLTTCPGDRLLARLFSGSGSSARPLASHVSAVAALMGGNAGGGIDHDVNGDGISDVVRPNRQGAMASLGGTSAWQQRRRAVRPWTTAVGDFDGDGHDDVLHADGVNWRLLPGPDHTAWLRWRGDAPVRASDMRVADVNRDGRDDVVVSGAHRFLWRSGGQGNWRPLSPVVAPIKRTVVGDFDGNGHVDLLNTTGGTWRILPGPRHDGWQRLRRAGMTVSDLAFGDVNGDGRQDAVRQTGSELQWRSGATGAWERLSGSLVPIDEVVLEDITSDGRADIVWGDGERVRVRAAPNFAAWRPVMDSTRRGPNLHVADLAAGPRNDVVDVRSDRLEAGGMGTQVSETLRAARPDPARVHDGDFTGDGVTDLLWTTGQQWLLARGPHMDSWQHLINGSVTRVLIGDVNGDGRADAFNRPGGQDGFRYRSGARGRWISVGTSSTLWPTLALADVDGDDTDDVVVATGTHLLWKAGPGDGSWQTWITTTAAMRDLHFVDVAGDEGDEVVLLRDGMWRYSDGGAWMHLADATRGKDQVDFGDFNGDGRLDAITQFGGRWRVRYAPNFNRWRGLRPADLQVGEVLVTR